MLVRQTFLSISNAVLYLQDHSVPNSFEPNSVFTSSSSHSQDGFNGSKNVSMGTPKWNWIWLQC